MEITCYDKYGRVIENIVQWDVGQSISIKGYDLTSYAPQIHFANANSEKALVVESVLSGGLLSCQVPNSLARENLPIIMYIYDAVGETGKTNAITKIPVTPRPMPDDVVYTDDVGVISLTEVLRQAREYMNNSLNYSTKAKESEEKAKTSADAAKVSETNAAKSENVASSSATQAAQSAKEAKAYVGSPLVANTVSAMTDQTKIYVYTGSESGYTAGNWYYHNGSTWVSGGVYNSSAVNVDKTLTQDGYAADAKVTGDAVNSLKGDIDSLTYIDKSINLFNPNDSNIKANSQIQSNGTIGTNSAWSSYVTDFIDIDVNGSKTLRQTLPLNIRIGEYKHDGTFIARTTINRTSPMIINDATSKIRVEFYETAGLMVYQSDTVQPYVDFYENRTVEDSAIPNTVTRNTDLIAIIDEMENQSIRISELEEFEVTNYALFVETYEGKKYNSIGLLVSDTNYNATSMAVLDNGKPIYPSNIYTGHAVFFDSDKNYISTVNCYSDSPVGISKYPENAKYVAFDYVSDIGNNNSGKWGTTWKKVRLDCSLRKVSLGRTKKRKGTRPEINIYTTDTQMEILEKLCDAYHTEDCDVVFERGEYTFDSVFVDMYDKEQRNYIELPIGGRNRYYFNGSTLTADQTTFNDAGYSATISLFSCIYTTNSSESYELYNGTLIGKGITYVVHDECGGKPNWYYHKYKNMHFIYNTLTQTNDIRKCIGGGTGLFGESIFENCVFETDHTFDLSFHGIDTSKEDVAHFNLKLSNCYLSKILSLDNLATNQTADAIITGCSAKAISSTGVVNKWNVKSWCNEVRTD